jgi:hypothetical protein
MLNIALALAAASVTEQMAPAKRGMLQCQMPNLESKTCFSLSKIRQTSPSTYQFETEILVDVAGVVTASMRSKVFTRGSEICQVMKPADATSATFASEGRPLSTEEAAEYRAKLRADFAAFAGHTICTRIVPGDEGVDTVVGTFDGRRSPAGDYAMKWVSPSDGWKVAP